MRESLTYREYRIPVVGKVLYNTLHHPQTSISLGFIPHKHCQPPLQPHSRIYVGGLLGFRHITSSSFYHLPSVCYCPLLLERDIPNRPGDINRSARYHSLAFPPPTVGPTAKSVFYYPFPCKNGSSGGAQLSTIQYPPSRHESHRRPTLTNLLNNKPDSGVCPLQLCLFYLHQPASQLGGFAVLDIAWTSPLGGEDIREARFIDFPVVVALLLIFRLVLISQLIWGFESGGFVEDGLLWLWTLTVVIVITAILVLLILVRGR